MLLLLLQTILIQETSVLFLNNSVIELQFLSWLKPVEIITQQHGQSWRGTAAKKQEPQSVSVHGHWSVDFIMHKKRWKPMRLVSKFAGDLLWLMSTDSGSEFGKININIEKYIYENIIIIKIKMSRIKPY